MLQFWCADGSENKEEKLELVKVEDTPINISDRSGYGIFETDAFISIQVKDKTEWNPYINVLGPTFSIENKVNQWSCRVINPSRNLLQSLF